MLELHRIRVFSAALLNLIDRTSRRLSYDELKILDAALDSFAVDLQNLRNRLRIGLARHSKENHE